MQRLAVFFGSLWAAAAVTSVAPAAHAWHAATTAAGIAEQAALASDLHRVLATQLGRPLGLFEPIYVSKQAQKSERLQWVLRRLTLLDPSGGHTPNEAGGNLALFWLTAGAVLENAPPERARHHFFDPRNQAGLNDNPGASGFMHSLRLAIDGAGGLRGIATGTAFDLTGRPALGWLLSADNELGLQSFLSAMERSASAETRLAREAAAAEALVCMGAIGAILADMGEPAHVRNDFRRAFLEGGEGAGPWDQSSDFERFVAQQYGRPGVPAPTGAVQRSSLQAYFSAADGQGLADRTSSEFFSPGTVPHAVPIVESDTTPKQVHSEAARSLTFAKPALGRLNLRAAGRQYQIVGGRRQLAYERVPGRVLFFLDEAVYADTASHWLPIVGSYVAGLFNQLVRVKVDLAYKQIDGVGKVTVNLGGFQGAATGTLQLYAEDDAGRRRPLGAPLQLNVAASERISPPASQSTSSQQGALQAPVGAVSPTLSGSAAPGASSPGSFQRGASTAESPSTSLTVTLPPGVSRVAAAVRGQDSAGAFVAVAAPRGP